MKKKKNTGTTFVLAYTSCAAAVADNMAPDCAHPLVSGFTGRGVLINWSDNPTLTFSGANPRIITAITLASGVKVSVIDNAAVSQPFNGSSEQSNNDEGIVKYQKTVVAHIMARGANAAKNIIEPLSHSPLGFLLILEKKDKVGDGSFVCYGVEQGMKANADGIVRNEYENGGTVVATMSCLETVFEYTLFDTDYDTTKALFDTLITKAF